MLNFFDLRRVQEKEMNGIYIIIIILNIYIVDQNTYIHRIKEINWNNVVNNRLLNDDVKALQSRSLFGWSRIIMNIRRSGYYRYRRDWVELEQSKLLCAFCLN